MAGKFKTIAAGTGTRLIFAGALIAVAVHMVRPPAREAPATAPATATIAKPATHRPPQLKAPDASAAKPAPAEPAEQAFIVRRVLAIDGPLRHGDYVWDDKGVPAGPLVITIDLAAQTLSVFRDGYEIGTAVILYGADNYPTPLGTFPILEKDAHHVSNLYDAPMPYMLRLTNDGVAIHGGAEVEWGSATHGCIGVPTKFAALLFAQAKLRDRVIITNGKRLRVGQQIAA